MVTKSHFDFAQCDKDYLENTNPTFSLRFTFIVSPSTKLLASNSYKAKMASMINFPILSKENNKTFKIKKGHWCPF